MIQAKTSTIVFCAALTFLGLAVPAMAFNPQPEPPGSVAVGLVSDQFVRVTVTNSTDRVSGIVPCVCPILVTLLDELGKTVASHEMDVFPGEVGSFETDLGLLGGERRLVRALVEFNGGEGARLVCNAATRSGLEIVGSADGATKIAVPIVTSYLPPASP